MSDLIDRQLVLGRINKQREHLRPYLYPQDKIGDSAYRICAEFVERLPSAEPERKKGKWIPNSPVTMKCDQCGCVIKDWDWHRFKYCPNCRAYMEE